MPLRNESGEKDFALWRSGGSRYGLLSRLGLASGGAGK